jgi:hypothetical protein
MDECKAATESPIALEMKSLVETNSRLESVVERLRGRLDPVCSAPKPEPTTDEQAIRTPECSYHEELRTQINRIDGVVGRLSHIETALQL